MSAVAWARSSQDRPHPAPTPLRGADQASTRPGITSLPPATTGHFGGFGPGLRQAMASSGRAALTPRARVPACHIAATGHDWLLRQIRTRPSWRDDGRIALVAGKHVHARPHRAERRNSAIALAGAFKELHLDGICLRTHENDSRNDAERVSC